MASKKTCFVIIGFGPKPDHETGRIIDLDKTFEHLIKPVFDELNISCFRAKDIKHMISQCMSGFIKQILLLRTFRL